MIYRSEIDMNDDDDLSQPSALKDVPTITTDSTAEPMRPVCSQEWCGEVGAYRYTWPGQDEALICEHHVGIPRNIAKAIGMPLQIIEL